MEFIRFWRDCIVEGFHIGEHCFAFIEGICFLVGAGFLWAAKHHSRWEKAEKLIMKWAFAIFAVSFLISTIFVAPFLKFSEEHKSSAQNTLLERIDRLTQSNQMLLSEKEQLVNRLDTYAIVAGVTNHSYNQKIETFFKEYEE